MTPRATSLLRQLGIGSATALVISNMIGTGILTTSGFLAGQLGSAQLVLSIWGVGAVCALAGRVLLFRIGRELSQLRRRVRLSHRSLRAHLGLHDRLDFVFRRILRAHRRRGPGIFRLSGTRGRFSVLRNRTDAVRRRPDSGQRHHRAVHHPQLPGDSPHRARSKCADLLEDSDHSDFPDHRVRFRAGKLGEFHASGGAHLRHAVVLAIFRQPVLHLCFLQRMERGHLRGRGVEASGSHASTVARLRNCSGCGAIHRRSTCCSSTLCRWNR